MASFAVPTETVFGWGCAAEVGPRAAQAGFGRALLVTDRGVRGAGLTGSIEASLRGAGVIYDVFDAVSPNPRDTEAEACLAALADLRADVLVAVGGGSAIDTAKAAAVLRANGGRARDWCPAVGGRTPPRPGLPLYALPTTTGTGSEVSGGAVLTFDLGDPSGRASKNGIGNCQPALALLDPELVVRLPAPVLAASGLDALSHATESYVSPNASLFTRAFSVQALRTLAWALPAAWRAAGTPGADRRPTMEAMLYAASLAGRSMMGRTGQVHAISRAVGAYFDTVHGLTNAVLLPVVLTYHEPALRTLLAEVGYLLGDSAGAPQMTAPTDSAAAAARTIEAIGRLRDALGAPARLRDLGVPRGALPQIAAEALRTEQAQSPRPATQADLLAICDRAW
jgi:alcohol dehydrogenase class IV